MRSSTKKLQQLSSMSQLSQLDDIGARQETEMHDTKKIEASRFIKKQDSCDPVIS